MRSIRILLLPLAISASLWCSSGLSTYDLADNAELNLGDGASDGFFSSYWNTFYCQVVGCDPACTSGALNPYYGPAWYNFNYGGWGFDDDGPSHAHRGHKKHHKHKKHCGSGRCGSGH